MEKIKLSETLQVSRIVLGLWRLSEWNMEKEEILHLMEECKELGITTFDHADIYGDYTCEALFGEALALKPALRRDIQIITKCGIKLVSKNRPDHKIKYYDTSKKHIIHSVENSLRNFRTDYIDLLLIHRPDPLMNPAEVAEAFAQLKAEGKVLNFGVSNFSPSQFHLLNSYLNFPLVTNQVELSVSNLSQFVNGCIEQCQERNIPPMAWSPLAGGEIFYSENEKEVRLRETLHKIKGELNIDSIDQVMYAWLLNHPANIIPIVGSGKVSRIRKAVDALNIHMTREQWFEVWQSSVGKEVD
ncbi:aldo/keto reductase [Bacillus sp. SM2101]|uniref:aldo/keto reductase n=1 Tax=Bacillus sp. SM2101 TaxID=2805366 RepID=UPI001BDDFEEE|nr:aldo/keto reductase [Bacillus sp. SM2101]